MNPHPRNLLTAADVANINANTKGTLCLYMINIVPVIQVDTIIAPLSGQRYARENYACIRETLPRPPGRSP